MPPYPREELEAMVERWLQANRDSERDGTWARHLASMYTEDAEYGWNMGPEQEFLARGRREIEEIALGFHMEGFEAWRYPYDRVLIDENLGEVIGIWRQVAPAVRADGTPYEVAGLGGSWFRYGGNQQWSWQRDFFDLGNVKALFMELAADGKLDAAVKRKIARLSRGQSLPGVTQTRRTGLLKKLWGVVCMIRIVLTGK